MKKNYISFKTLMEKHNVCAYNPTITFTKTVETKLENSEFVDVDHYFVEIDGVKNELPTEKKWVQGVLNAEYERAAKWLIKKYMPLPKSDRYPFF